MPDNQPDVPLQTAISVVVSKEFHKKSCERRTMTKQTKRVIQ